MPRVFDDPARVGTPARRAAFREDCGFRKFWRVFSGKSGHFLRWGWDGRIVKAEVLGAVGRPVEREESTAFQDAIDNRVREVLIVQDAA